MTVDSMAIHFLPQAQSNIPFRAAFPFARFRGFQKRRMPHFPDPALLAVPPLPAFAKTLRVPRQIHAALPGPEDIRN
jgi:hypothetical protein